MARKLSDVIAEIQQIESGGGDATELRQKVAEFQGGKYADRLPPLPQPDPVIAEPTTGSYSPLSIAGEFANAANRGVADTLDFLGPGTINAGLRLFGSDYQLPTFGGGLSATPGGEGGFMPEGTARDVVRGAGLTTPAAGGLIPVAGRSLATAGGAIPELIGFGTQGAPSAAASASRAASLSGDLSAGPAANIVARADELGWPLSFGDRTGNRTIKNIESAIESASMPANPMHRINDQRQGILRRVAAESVGEPSDARLTQDVVGDVADRLSSEFESLTNLDRLPVGDQFLDDLVDVQTSARSRLFSDPDIGKTVNKIFDKIDGEGTLSVSDYQDLSSELKAKARMAWKGESPDPYFAESLGQMVDALDRLAMDNTAPEALEALRVARRQWKALSQLEKSRAIHESGDISGPLLANYLRRTDKGGYGRGKNVSELYEAARLSKAFPSRPDSGTAGRQFLNNLLQNPVSGGASLLFSPVTSTLANAFVRGPSGIGRLAANAEELRAPLLAAGRLYGSEMDRR
jgi:hypothetical protein